MMREEKQVVAVICAFVILATILIWWVMSTISAEAESCEQRGGHLYSRQVGKVTHHKCVTDDNEVLM